MPPVFSRDGLHVGVVVKPPQGGAETLLVDGASVASYPGITNIRLAPDGASVSFLARRDAQGSDPPWLFVHRGTPIALPDEGTELVVTPPGEHYAYTYLVPPYGDHKAIVRDGRNVGQAADARELCLTEDGKRFAYVLRPSARADGELAVIDGARGPTYGAIWGLAFSDDGRHVAYTALGGQSAERATIVLDGREGRRYRSASETPRFAPDGRLVYDAADERGAVLVIDRREYGPYRTFVAGPVVKSRIAWAAETLEQGRVVAHVFVDGAEVHRRDAGTDSPLKSRAASVSSLVVTPTQVAFATTGGVRVVDASGERILPEGAPLAFDAGGSRLAMLRWEDSRVVVRAVELAHPDRLSPAGPPVTEVYLETVRFADEGRTLRYAARQDEALVAVEQGTGAP